MQYYQDKHTTLYNMDCIRGMGELPDGLFDLICTSPPYNIGKEYEKDQTFGEYLKLLSDFYTEGFRVIKKGGYAVVVYADYYMFGNGDIKVQPMTYLHHIIAEKAGWIHQCTRVWIKDFPSLSDPYTINTNLPKLEVEWVSTFKKPGGGKDIVREHTYHQRQCWSTAGKRQKTSTLKNHPAAFPEHLVVMILSVYSDPNDIVIDPFAGSSTVGYVAKKMGRRSIMIEINPGYCEISKERLCQQVWQCDDDDQSNKYNSLQML